MLATTLDYTTKGMPTSSRCDCAIGTWGLGTDRADASYIMPTANNLSNDSTSSNDEGARNLSPHDDEIRQPLSPQESHTKVILDMVISEFTKLLTNVGPYRAGDVQAVDVV